MTFHALPNFRSRTTGRRTTCRATQVTRSCAPSSNEGEIGIAAPIGGSARVLPDLPVTRCDAVDRGCPMPATESGRRDWPGLEVAAGPKWPWRCEPASGPVGGQILPGPGARRTAAWALLGCWPLCVARAGPATEAGTFGVAGAKAVAGKGVSCG
jgi:hypothetical protein